MILIKQGELCLNAMNLSKNFTSKTVFFCLKYLWAQYLKRLTKRQKNTLKKLLIYKPLSSKKNLKKFIFIAKGVLKSMIHNK